MKIDSKSGIGGIILGVALTLLASLIVETIKLSQEVGAEKAKADVLIALTEEVADARAEYISLKNEAERLREEVKGIQEQVKERAAEINLTAKEVDRYRGAADSAVEEIASSLESAAIESLLDKRLGKYTSCQWYNLEEEQAYEVWELTKQGTTAPDFGCPEGSFMTHVDQDSTKPQFGVHVTRTRCCKF